LLVFPSFTISAAADMAKSPIGQWSQPPFLPGIISGFLDFFYPPFCLICHNMLDDARRLVCPQCWSSFESYGDFPVQIPASLKTLQTVMVGLLGQATLDDPLNDIIRQLKYDRRAALAQGLADRMALVLSSYPWLKHIDMIVPVPLHPSRVRSRGYNQSQLLAEHLGNMFGLPVVSKVLARIRPTESQTRLNQEQRRKNVAGAFRVPFPEEIEGKRILLVDDVVTTGATLDECARTLEKSGAMTVHAAAAVHFQTSLP